MTPLKAIREKCLDCMCGSAFEVKLCPIKDCTLHPYRFGHNPARAGIGGKVFNSEKPDSTSDFKAENEDEGE